jgi:hypothetical protein
MARRFRTVDRDEDEPSVTIPVKGNAPEPDEDIPTPSTHDFGYFDKVVSSFSTVSSPIDTPPDATPDKAQVAAALERICASSAFHGSRRCQQFLRFIVEQTLHGHADELKERTIATEVFGRGTDFEPSEDSLVRVKARELRKRLESFYETDAELNCRIEIPLGGYTPRFISISRPISASPGLPAADPGPEIHRPTPVPGHWSRRRLLWTSASLLGGVILGAGAIWQEFHSASNNLEELWKPIFRTATPLVIFIPVLKDRDTNEVSDRIGIGPAQALRKVIDFLDARHYPYHLRFGSEMNFALL